MLDVRQTLAYANYLKEIGWIVERINGINFFVRKFPIIGSVIKIQRPERIDFSTIDALSKKHRAFQIIIEPKSSNQVLSLATYNYKLLKSPFLPSKTLHIDLTKNEERLLKDVHHKTRYNARKRMGDKLQIVNSKDIQLFIKFWHKCANERGDILSHKRTITSLYKAFSKSSNIIMAVHLNELVAAVFIVVTKDTTYYMYAAANKEGKKLFAPTLVAWEAIKTAKNKGCKVFDFEGIYDERFPLKSWRGFTRFKKSFGGTEVEYPGAFAKYRLPI